MFLKQLCNFQQVHFFFDHLFFKKTILRQTAPPPHEKPRFATVATVPQTQVDFSYEFVQKISVSPDMLFRGLFIASSQK